MRFNTLLDFFQPLDTTPVPAPTMSIAEIASGNENFDILVAALNATGNTQTFLDPGDFTVFAPTDAAFRELATTTLGLDVSALDDAAVANALVGALTADTVNNVLLYHVKAGGSTVKELQAEGDIDTLLTGGTVTVSGDIIIDVDGDVENPAFVAGLTDIQATNGTIQVIDRVLLPIDVDQASQRDTIADIAVGNDAFETLVAALTALDLVDVVADRDADLTVFAPTDDAFRALAGDLGLDVSALSDPEVAGALVDAVGAPLVNDIVLAHVSAGTNLSTEILSDRIVETLNGTPFAVEGTEIVDAEPAVANANLITSLIDIEAANGVIHAIDRVILPVEVGASSRQNETGTSADEVFYGGASNDFFFGKKGKDIFFGADGDDRLLGGSSTDWMLGGAGDDQIRGGFHDDFLVGGAGNDRMIGGFGDDTMIDGRGDDFMRGGKGEDTFDFTNLRGDNVVRGFNDEDRLVFSTDDFADNQAVLDAASRAGQSLEIESGSHSVTLLGVTSITEDDFVLL